MAWAAVALGFSSSFQGSVNEGFRAAWSKGSIGFRAAWIKGSRAAWYFTAYGILMFPLSLLRVLRVRVWAESFSFSAGVFKLKSSPSSSAYMMLYHSTRRTYISFDSGYMAFNARRVLFNARFKLIGTPQKTKLHAGARIQYRTWLITSNSAHYRGSRREVAWAVGWLPGARGQGGVGFLRAASFRGVYISAIARAGHFHNPNIIINFDARSVHASPREKLEQIRVEKA
ncbi:hypothetical protein C8R44DRAFT_728751 [Mycena epipterygia]|nr:hypothetical protein C8R44DRAFT_728751 [Mycena epipterygia]